MRLVLGALILCASGHSWAAAQAPVELEELANYRLTVPVFAQFTESSRLIAAATRGNAAFSHDPLFTPEVVVSGDAPAMAAVLQARLEKEPALADALRAAKLSARDYTKFSLVLFAARLAHGFVKAGVLRGVPAGVAADNVAFVEAHQIEIAAILRELGVPG
jgi:hypothetical protein